MINKELSYNISMPDKDISDNLYLHHPPIPDKRRLKISIVHRDTGAIFHMVRYFDKKLDNNDVLGIIWCEWNRGSGKESQRFLNTQTRNLMVGDVVSIQEGGAGRLEPAAQPTGRPTKHYVCEAVGWYEQLPDVGWAQLRQENLRVHGVNMPL